ncbi:MAG: hypothetical protein ACRD26_19385 [Vicinamibacterales bacterium]
METIGDWLQKRQTFIAVISPVGAALVGVGLSATPAPAPSLIALYIGLLIVFAAMPALAIRENRLRQGRKEAETCLKRVLVACASSFGYPTVHVRCNIMRYSKDRTRRRVDSRTAFNMDSDPDSDLEIDATAGASGEVELKRVPAYGDLSEARKPGAPDWGLRPPELAKVRRTLKSVLSVPVFNPHDAEAPLLATLQVDSDEPPDVVGFDDLESSGQLAQAFADVVSLLLAEVEK